MANWWTNLLVKFVGSILALWGLYNYIHVVDPLVLPNMLLVAIGLALLLAPKIE